MLQCIIKAVAATAVITNNSRNSPDFSQLSKRGIENIWSAGVKRESHNTSGHLQIATRKARIDFLAQIKPIYTAVLLSQTALLLAPPGTHNLHVSNRAALTFIGRLMRLFHVGCRSTPVPLAIAGCIAINDLRVSAPKWSYLRINDRTYCQIFLVHQTRQLMTTREKLISNLFHTDKPSELCMGFLNLQSFYYLWGQLCTARLSFQKPHKSTNRVHFMNFSPTYHIFNGLNK